MSGNGHDPDFDKNEDSDENGQIIQIKAARQKARRDQKNKNRPPREPLLNLPPVTKFMLAGLVLIHLVVTYAISAPDRYMLFHYIGFIPGYYSGYIDAFGPEPWIGPFAYMFFHGGWTHLLLNGVMLMAFGAGVERWLGGVRLFILFYGCSLAALIPHYILYMDSLSPVIGASGGLSGLFAAAIVMLQQQSGSPLGRFGLWPLIIIWVVISFFFGMTGGPDGGPIAWAAHIGGFIAGLLLLKPVMKLRI